MYSQQQSHSSQKQKQYVVKEAINHFSHNHGLVFHQTLPDQVSQTLCSGCKSPASGNVYVCWQCSYFLHEQCFRATRSLKHPSHPLHPLTLMPFPTYPSRSFICNSCNLIGDAFSYTCSQCEFDIHVHCAHDHMPNPINPHNFNSQPNADILIKNNELSRLLGQKEKVNLDEIMQMARQKKKAEAEEYVKKMEMEAELRRIRHNLAMQRLQQASDSIDLLGRII